MSPILLNINDVVDEMEKEEPGIFEKGGAIAQAHGLVNAAFAAGTMVGPFLGGFIRHAAGPPINFLISLIILYFYSDSWP